MLDSNYLFKDFINDFFDVSNFKPNILKADIFEENNMYVMEVEAPGFRKEDINIEYHDGYLVICAKKEEMKESKDYIKKERFYGAYQRSFYVGDINEEEICASFDNGILKLAFPKETKNKKNKKTIEIK